MFDFQKTTTMTTTFFEKKVGQLLFSKFSENFSRGYQNTKKCCFGRTSMSIGTLYFWNFEVAQLFFSKMCLSLMVGDVSFFSWNSEVFTNFCALLKFKTSFCHKTHQFWARPRCKWSPRSYKTTSTTTDVSFSKNNNNNSNFFWKKSWPTSFFKIFWKLF